MRYNQCSSPFKIEFLKNKLLKINHKIVVPVQVMFLFKKLLLSILKICFTKKYCKYHYSFSEFYSKCFFSV